MIRKKKTAKETVAEVIAKVDEELQISKVTVEVVAPNKVEEQTDTHYYRCNVNLDNGKPCNCTAFL